MPIRVRCTNQECHRELQVPDRLAGKAFRCPACQSVVRVPEPTPVAEDIVEEVVEDPTAIASEPRPKRETAVPVARVIADDDQDDEYEEDEDDVYDADEFGRQALKKSPANFVNVILFGVGTLFLIAASMVPLFSWISITSTAEDKFKNKTATAHHSITGMGTVTISANTLQSSNRYTKDTTMPPETAPEGLIFMIVGLLFGAVAVVGIVLAMFNVFGKGLSSTMAGLFSLLAEATSILLLVWLLAWVWKVVSLSEEFQKRATAVQGRIGVELSTTTFPGLGLLVGLGLAVGAAYAFSNLSQRIGRKSWSYLADLTGLILGGLVLVLIVQSWDAKVLFEGINAISHRF